MSLCGGCITDQQQAVGTEPSPCCLSGLPAWVSPFVLMLRLMERVLTLLDLMLVSALETVLARVWMADLELVLDPVLVLTLMLLGVQIEDQIPVQVPRTVLHSLLVLAVDLGSRLVSAHRQGYL